MSRTLPDYRKPPVVEVAISVFFQPLPKLTTVRFGEFWVNHRDEYPKTEDYPPVVENFTPEFMTLPPIRRIFMLTEDERYVLQLQQDGFIHNWRRMKDNDEYPHFEAARARFKDKFAEFQSFVRKNELGHLNVSRYEVTYVNHLPGTNITDTMTEYIGLLQLQTANERKLLPAPRAMTADLWFEMPDDRGTLRLSFKQGARTSDKKEVLQVELTARSKANSDYSDMDTWLELAHEWIVKGFTEITSAHAHQAWERIL